MDIYSQESYQNEFQPKTSWEYLHNDDYFIHVNISKRKQIPYLPIQFHPCKIDYRALDLIL